MPRTATRNVSWALAYVQAQLRIRLQGLRRAIGARQTTPPSMLVDTRMLGGAVGARRRDPNIFSMKL